MNAGAQNTHYTPPPPTRQGWPRLDPIDNEDDEDEERNPAHAFLHPDFVPLSLFHLR